MRNAPSIDVVFGPSRLAAAVTGIAALATLVVALALPAPPLVQAIVGAVILTWAWSTLRSVALRAGSAGVVALHLGADRLVVVRHVDGRSVAGHLRTATYVSPLVTSVVWRPDGAWRTLMAFEVTRARALLESGRPLVAALPRRLGLELAGVIAGGLRICARIDAVDGDVFTRRPTLRARDWCAVAYHALLMRRAARCARQAR